MNDGESVLVLTVGLGILFLRGINPGSTWKVWLSVLTMERDQSMSEQGPGCRDCGSEHTCQMRADKLARPDIFKEPCKFKHKIRK